jgi:pimeloyl-ACP methyl ester carboxylesterase
LWLPDDGEPTAFNNSQRAFRSSPRHPVRHEPFGHHAHVAHLRSHPPETWVRRAYRNLIYFREVEKGGHFAAWEEPELFTAELRAAFRSLRPAL